MKRSGKCNCRTHSFDYGFTLIELLAVIAIIGLLASFLLPAISRARERAKIGYVKGQLAQIETALSQYYTEWDTYPPMGNDWLGGGFFPSEDVGSDGQGPFILSGGQWITNPNYHGPDTDGTEGNYRLDPNEDGVVLGEYNKFVRNGKLDGTYYDRLGMFADASKPALMDIFANKTYYHYYAGCVSEKTDLGMPIYNSYNGFYDPTTNPDGYGPNNCPMYYNRWVLYSVGIDGKDHALHNYYLTMMDGEDVGTDAYASDVMDNGSGTPNAVSDNDGVIFEPSIGENNSQDDTLVSGTIRETRWVTPGGPKESQAPGGNGATLEGPSGNPVFNYDVRQERRRRGQVYATPDGDPQAYGAIMRYGP